MTQPVASILFTVISDRESLNKDAPGIAVTHDHDAPKVSTLPLVRPAC